MLSPATVAGSPTRRVGIMSMQRILNYGSSLQAYGLSRLLSDLDESVDVSFVDYVPGAVLVEDPQGTSRATRLVRKVVEHAHGDASIADKMRFFNHKRRYAGRNFPLLGIPRDRNHDLNLDVEIIGSDEVFNCIQASSNVGYSPDLFGRGTSARRVVSYAASFGNTTLSRIEAAGIGDTLKRDLSSFHEISVRDRNSYEIVSALTGRPPPIHVDPVLAYDFMGLERRVPCSACATTGTWSPTLYRGGSAGRRTSPWPRSHGASARESSVSVAPNHVATGSSTAIRSSCWRTSVTPRRCSRTRSMERSWPSSTSGRSRPRSDQSRRGDVWERGEAGLPALGPPSRGSSGRGSRRRLGRPVTGDRLRTGQDPALGGAAAHQLVPHPCRARERRSSMKTNPLPRVPRSAPAPRRIGLARHLDHDEGPPHTDVGAESELNAYENRRPPSNRRTSASPFGGRRRSVRAAVRRQIVVPRPPS